ncbi:Hypothetical protein D9617_3g019380 [Elsinoe fawcettii]|nr:Hypothetical protein D9617_3g019380 [Elsinoe fawcettii]
MSSKPSRPVSVAVSAPPISKPPCKIDPTATISDKAILVGSHPITIGARTVLHPFAKVDSTNGPVSLGTFCIVSERAAIGPGSQVASGSSVAIEDHVNIETGAVIESNSIGKCSIVGAYAQLDANTQLGKFCKIAPKCTLSRGTALPDFTVLLDAGHSRIDTTTSSRRDIQDLKIKGQVMHVDTLKRLIPSNIAKWA